MQFSIVLNKALSPFSETGRKASLAVVGSERKEGGTTNKVTNSFTHSLCSARKCASLLGV